MFESWRRRWWRRRWSSVIYFVLVFGALIIPFVTLPENLKYLSPFFVIVVGVGGNLLANVIESWRGGPTSTSLSEAKRRYLLGLRKHCELLPLAALGGDEGLDETITLDKVYIALDTTTPAPQDEAELSEPRAERHMGYARGEDRRLLTAREGVTQSPWLVLLGDPGAGKSTFVRQILAEVATAQLAQTTTQTDLPSHLLPVLITLRSLAARLDQRTWSSLSLVNRRLRLARTVCDQAMDDLTHWDAEAFADGLRDALESGRCFLVLDGLDEVPEHLRSLVRESVRAVIGVYNLQKVIVTCRIRSYTGEAVLTDFQAHRLAPFDRAKIAAFIQGWYHAQHSLGRFSDAQAKLKAEDLAHAAQQSALLELAANPMLLTTMAIIHQRNIGLPKKRVRLYHLAVELLLRRWERHRGDGGGITPDADLAAVLSDDRRLRSVMEVLAYEAHRIQQGGRTGEDLPRGMALTLIDQPAYLGNINLAQKFLDYVDERAGLLVGQGSEPGKPGSYQFPHRQFQEYLAACHLVCQRDPLRAFRDLTDEGDYWTQVIHLGAEELRYNRPRLYELLNLAYSLCQSSKPTGLREQRSALWSGIMAALAGEQEVAQDSAGGAAYLQRLRPALMQCMQGELTAPERAEAGKALAKLGDPRFRPAAEWFLPADAMLGFVKIEAGAFWMGSDPKRDRDAHEDEQPQHRVHLSTYYLARYPVTVAQFRVFVEASGYAWEGKGVPQGEANHPVVGVSWHDAMAYGKWLTETLRDWSETPEALRAHLKSGGCLTLPSEAQWEKAARGDDGRIYPWGDEADADLGNYDDTGIGGTSAVGCFVRGERLYEVYDMSGNVWEWCLDWYDEDYYQQSPERDPKGPAAGASRVYRGGSWSNDAQFVRAAFRSWHAPGYRLGHLGFRCSSSEVSQ